MLCDFLSVQKGDVISFVGGGGKTSLMLMLAKEISMKSKVIVTTTTKMGINEIPYRFKRIELSKNNSIRYIQKCINKSNSPLAIYNKIIGDKIIGANPEFIDRISKKVNITLVEADGARHLPVKIPKSTEPVIPKSTTKTVIIYGCDGLNKPIGPDTCYNIEGIIDNIQGINIGQILNPQRFRQIFLEGGYTRTSPRNKLYVIINKAEKKEVMAEKFARYLYHPCIEGIAISSAKEEWVKKIDNSNRKISGIILAAGEGKRFGGVKLLEQLNGIPIIEKVIQNALSHDFLHIILVLGEGNDKFLQKLNNNTLRRVKIVVNPDYKYGISTSFKKGLNAAKGSDAIMIFLGDMPFITKGITEKVIKSYKNSCAWACRAISNNKPGHPVVIGNELYNDLKNIYGDEGARRTLDKYKDRVLLMEVDPESQYDIDSQEDLDKSRKMKNA